MSKFKRINATIQKLTQVALLHITYFIGIGITAILARLVGKRFFGTHKGSNWRNHTRRGSFLDMY